ncbi:hypothetical protein ANOBCDAF_04416 [Pleomorphomonas sp. T1.2MG-36]|nr:hypothetical protein ANOBCDAF_04416 [Pleomorphomonas sp. T1.2MG-36]
MGHRRYFIARVFVKPKVTNLMSNDDRFLGRPLPISNVDDLARTIEKTENTHADNGPWLVRGELQVIYFERSPNEFGGDIVATVFL